MTCVFKHGHSCIAATNGYDETTSATTATSPVNIRPTNVRKEKAVFERINAMQKARDTPTNAVTRAACKLSTK